MASVLILDNDPRDCDSCPLCGMLPGACIDDIGDCPLIDVCRVKLEKIRERHCTYPHADNDGGAWCN